MSTIWNSIKIICYVTRSKSYELYQIQKSCEYHAHKCWPLTSISISPLKTQNYQTPNFDIKPTRSLFSFFKKEPKPCAPKEEKPEPLWMKVFSKKPKGEKPKLPFVRCRREVYEEIKEAKRSCKPLPVWKSDVVIVTSNTCEPKKSEFDCAPPQPPRPPKTVESQFLKLKNKHLKAMTLEEKFDIHEDSFGMKMPYTEFKPPGKDKIESFSAKVVGNKFNYPMKRVSITLRPKFGQADLSLINMDPSPTFKNSPKFMDVENKEWMMKQVSLASLKSSGKIHSCDDAKPNIETSTPKLKPFSKERSSEHSEHDKSVREKKSTSQIIKPKTGSIQSHAHSKVPFQVLSGIASSFKKGTTGSNNLHTTHFTTTFRTEKSKQADALMLFKRDSSLSIYPKQSVVPSPDKIKVKIINQSKPKKIHVLTLKHAEKSTSFPLTQHTNANKYFMLTKNKGPNAQQIGRYVRWEEKKSGNNSKKKLKIQSQTNMAISGPRDLSNETKFSTDGRKYAHNLQKTLQETSERQKNELVRKRQMNLWLCKVQRKEGELQLLSKDAVVEPPKKISTQPVKPIPAAVIKDTIYNEKRSPRSEHKLRLRNAFSANDLRHTITYNKPSLSQKYDGIEKNDAIKYKIPDVLKLKVLSPKEMPYNSRKGLRYTDYFASLQNKEVAKREEKISNVNKKDDSAAEDKSKSDDKEISSKFNRIQSPEKESTKPNSADENISKYGCSKSEKNEYATIKSNPIKPSSSSVSLCPLYENSYNVINNKEKTKNESDILTAALGIVIPVNENKRIEKTCMDNLGLKRSIKKVFRDESPKEYGDESSYVKELNIIEKAMSKLVNEKQMSKEIIIEDESYGLLLNVEELCKPGRRDPMLPIKPLPLENVSPKLNTITKREDPFFRTEKNEEDRDFRDTLNKSDVDIKTVCGNQSLPGLSETANIIDGSADIESHIKEVSNDKEKCLFPEVDMDCEAEKEKEDEALKHAMYLNNLNGNKNDPSGSTGNRSPTGSIPDSNPGRMSNKQSKSQTQFEAHLPCNDFTVQTPDVNYSYIRNVRHCNIEDPFNINNSIMYRLTCNSLKSPVNSLLNSSSSPYNDKTCKYRTFYESKLHNSCSSWTENMQRLKPLSNDKKYKTIFTSFLKRTDDVARPVINVLWQTNSIGMCERILAVKQIFSSGRHNGSVKIGHKSNEDYDSENILSKGNIRQNLHWDIDKDFNPTTGKPTYKHYPRYDEETKHVNCIISRPRIERENMGILNPRLTRMVSLPLNLVPEIAQLCPKRHLSLGRPVAFSDKESGNLESTEELIRKAKEKKKEEDIAKKCCTEYSRKCKKIRMPRCSEAIGICKPPIVIHKPCMKLEAPSPSFSECLKDVPLPKAFSECDCNAKHVKPPQCFKKTKGLSYDGCNPPIKEEVVCPKNIKVNKDEDKEKEKK